MKEYEIVYEDTNIQYPVMIQVSEQDLNDVLDAIESKSNQKLIEYYEI